MELINSNDYFDLIKVNNNSYAAIKKDKMLMSNAGFVDLGNVVVIFDTFLSVEAAKVLKQLVYQLTSPDKIFIVNSHQHIDHFLGNVVFKNETIISSLKITNKMIEMKQKVKFGNNYYTNYLKELEEKLNTTTEDEEKLNINNSLIFIKNYNNDESEIILPNITFSNELSIYGNNGVFSLQVTNKAHSEEDIIGINDKVLFAGDLIFIDEHPYIGAGDPINLIKVLEELYKHDFEYIIPGHGPICQKDKILDQIQYIKLLIDLVTKNIENTNNIKVSDLPEKFINQNYLAFRWNVDFLAKYLK